jgi:hypothetical protein
MPRKYVPKGNQRCTACGRKGHNSKNPLCPESVGNASAVKGARADVREAQAELAGPAGAELPTCTRSDGTVEHLMTVEAFIRIRSRVAAKVAS